ncbi:MAG: hypothetical protein ABW110_07925 [Steroidobacteraceae bacterium]
MTRARSMWMIGLNEWGMQRVALGYTICVNSVHPGGIQTDVLHSIMTRHVERLHFNLSG